MVPGTQGPWTGRGGATRSSAAPPKILFVFAFILGVSLFLWPSSDVFPRLLGRLLGSSRGAAAAPESDPAPKMPCFALGSFCGRAALSWTALTVIAFRSVDRPWFSDLGSPSLDRPPRAPPPGVPMGKNSTIMRARTSPVTSTFSTNQRARTGSRSPLQAADPPPLGDLSTIIALAHHESVHG